MNGRKAPDTGPDPAGPAAAPLALRHGAGEALWFLDFLAAVKGSAAEMNGAATVIEFLGRAGSGSPLHRHLGEDEWWYVLDGAMTFWVAGQAFPVRAGAFVYGPRGLPHTFRVTSPEARFLHVTEPGGFDGFLRSLARPAPSLEIPPADVALPDLEHVRAVAADYGIEVLGPPGIPAATAARTLGDQSEETQ
ncbi:cupin domain-containing protein [Streptomyces sp. BR123]|uniref:cupin domain-containing protein n=1 Tax=Streptomyces sp. BR123 TaxID=2749828 RepID=UPI0015C4A55F|nr:cupin domain-containing protein [Streptomyces sp. BR123]NXY94798.1 cupin domain-containing protein [Streptomyces sp. BR123]